MSGFDIMFKSVFEQIIGAAKKRRQTGHAAEPLSVLIHTIRYRQTRRNRRRVFNPNYAMSSDKICIAQVAQRYTMSAKSTGQGGQTNSDGMLDSLPLTDNCRRSVFDVQAGHCCQGAMISRVNNKLD